MVIAIVPVIVGIAGALLYALSNNGKLQEIGRIAFAAAAFALCFMYAGHVVALGPH